MDTAAVLFAPTRERLVASNAWAFLHALRTAGTADIADWAGLLEWAAANPVAARAAVRDFARRPDLPQAACGHFADMLLFLDARPDDVLLVADAQPWPWQAASELGIALHRHTGAPGAVLEAAMELRASILAVPASWLDSLSFQRRQRLDLRALRSIVTLGGPLSAEASGRIYAWVKPDVMLLARAGDRVWGDPLGPVLSRPVLSPGLGSLIRR